MVQFDLPNEVIKSVNVWRPAVPEPRQFRIGTAGTNTKFPGGPQIVARVLLPYETQLSSLFPSDT
ncbi:MAG: hypothetical protein ACI9G1_004485 [Pirellulaceae bacterium]